MKSHKHFIVLGLGTFGSAVATRLSQNGCRVTGVDRSEERVEELKDVLYEAVVADVTDRQALQQLPLKTADAVFISLGEDYLRSILAALHIKELGARSILVKGVTKEHGKILEKLGVDRVIFAETEMGVQLADSVTWPNVLDYLPIDPEYNLVQLAVPASFAGKTLQEVDLRRKYGVTVVGVKDVLLDKLILAPDGNFRMTEDQMLLAIGRKVDLERLRNVK
jgi:trk system potassium uptake protein TrkA